MFRDFIEYPIDPIPAEYVNTLSRLDCEPDYSLTCLGIALLKNRIKDYSGIIGKYGTFDKKASCIHDFHDLIEKGYDKPTLCYYIYSRNDEVDMEFVEHQLPGFKEKKSIAAFVKENTEKECMALYHEEKNQAVIFVNSGDIRIYHLLLTFLPLYFPPIFKEHPMEKEEYDLIKSLSKKEKDAFVTSIQKFVTPYVTEFRRIQLGNLLKQMHETKVQNIKGQVDQQRRNVDNAEARLADAIQLLKRLIIEYEGTKIVESYSEAEENLVEYLSTNKAVHNLNIMSHTLYFSVATLLNNYNEQAWEIFAKRGNIYDGKYSTELLDVFKDIENRKILLNDLFSESPQFLIKIAGNYQLNFATCTVNSDRGYNYNRADPLYKSYLPNPHLKLFSCLGGYKTKIINEMKIGNYIGAIELCIASAGSVDLDETEQTFRPFLGWVLSSKEKILRRNDGVEMTPEEALIWLIDKEKKDETN